MIIDPALIILINDFCSISFFQFLAQLHSCTPEGTRDHARFKGIYSSPLLQKANACITCDGRKKQSIIFNPVRLHAQRNRHATLPATLRK